MGREELPSFDEALDRFGAFLMAREWPDTVGWVLGEDLAWAEGVLLIRPGARQTREALVRSLFECGRDHAFGVELRAIAECRGETLATLVVPTEPRPEARDTHASGKLKLVVPPNTAHARAVHWGATPGAELLTRNPAWLGEVPFMEVVAV